MEGGRVPARGRAGPREAGGEGGGDAGPNGLPQATPDKAGRTTHPFPHSPKWRGRGRLALHRKGAIHGIRRRGSRCPWTPAREPSRRRRGPTIATKRRSGSGRVVRKGSAEEDHFRAKPGSRPNGPRPHPAPRGVPATDRGGAVAGGRGRWPHRRGRVRRGKAGRDRPRSVAPGSAPGGGEPRESPFRERSRRRRSRPR